MKIKLIQPTMLPRPMDTKLKTRMSSSLALLTIANLTAKEHEVIIENENVEKIDFDEHVGLNNVSTIYYVSAIIRKN